MVAGGFDGNTLYNGNNNIGITVNNGYSINFNSFGGSGTIMSIGNNNILTYKTISTPSLFVSGTVELGGAYEAGDCSKQQKYQRRPQQSQAPACLAQEVEAPWRYGTIN